MASKKAEFLVFYQRYVGALQAYFRRLGVTKAEQIADLVQESFVESYRSWDSLQSEATAQAWLHTIARRQLARSIRKNRHYILSEVEDAALSSTASTPSNQESNLEAQRFCQIVLNQLALTRDDARRQALTAYYLEEKSFREIASESGINLSTLTTWCSRFRQECLKKLPNPQQDSYVPLKSLLASKKGAKL
ncbi:RNA polymerase sigma factor [Oligoflexus tunisiensis]|uniref:RNA polymerase sigma factor n=1 Tax=Oligoflexus tunisiensis TaxID=708132 RepID=UPI00159EF957|nr:RNA polymerase sigma factor [Oligoflexus tunisiensis]